MGNQPTRGTTLPTLRPPLAKLTTENFPLSNSPVNFYKYLDPSKKAFQVAEFLVSAAESSRSQQDFISDIEKKQYKKIPHLSPVICIENDDSKELCFTSKANRIFLEVYPTSLRKLIGASGRRDFSESDIQRMLLQGAEMLAELSNYNKYHGFIIPDFIFVNLASSPATFIFLDTEIIQSSPNFMQRNEMRNSIGAPLDPSLISALKRNAPSSFDESKDIWALAICALSMIYNEHYLTYYNVSDLSIKMNVIEDRLRNLSQKNIGQKVTKVLTDMLRPDVKQRISAMGIKEVLSNSWVVVK